MVSPLCEVKDGSGAYQSTDGGVNVTPANVITIRLIDTSADVWSIACLSTDDLSSADDVNEALVVNHLLRTATFTAPAEGRAYIFQSVVNRGVGPNGKIVSAYTTTFGIYTVQGGTRVLAVNETTEGGESGWISPVNWMIRNGAGAGSAVADDIGKSAGSAIDRVRGFNGVALETTDTPSPGDVWVKRGSKYRSAKPSPWVNVKDFGAVGDGVADDTTAIQLAVAAVKAATLASGQGARLHFPAGVYRCSSMLDFDSTDGSHLYQSVTICGDGGGLTGSWRSASTLIYTGGNVRAFISARSSLGFSIKDMAVLYNNSAFEGTLVDLSHSAAGYDTNNATLSGCIFASDGVLLTTAKNLILLDSTICSVIENCTIYGAVAGIRGVGGTGYTVEHAAGYVNRVTIYGCSFDKCTLGAIVNPVGQGWVISNNTFELINMPTALTCDATSGGPGCSGLRFEGNWLGDCNIAYNLIGAVHNNGYLRFQGASFDNNYFGLPFEKRAIVIGPSFGVSITGNVIGTIDFSLIPGEGTLCHGVTVTGNYLQGDNTEDYPWFKGICQFDAMTHVFVGMLQENRVYIAGNNHTTQGPLDHRVMSGHIVTIPTLFAQPTILGVTNIAATLDGAWYKGSNDIAGRITLVSTGGGGAAGEQCTLTFKHKYDSSNGTKPKVVLMPENAAAATVSGGIYVDPDFATFDIVAPSGLPAGTYVWAYHVFG